MDNLGSSVVKSVVLHLALAAGLVASASLNFTHTPKVMEVNLNPSLPEPEKAVSAMTVDQQKVEQKIAELKKQEDDKKQAEAKRIRDLERRANDARKQREAEDRRLKMLEQQRRAKEKEKAEAEAQAKRAREIQEKERAKAKQAEKQKQEAEAAAKAAADKRKAEEEALKKAEEERKRKEAEAERKRQQALQEQMLQEQLAKEQAARNKVRQQQVLSEVDKYKALIMARIQQTLLIDEKMKGKQCRVNIRLGFNGLVTQVKSLGGDKLVCEAALRAVRMADTLPVSKDKDVFEQLKNINLTIKPEF